MYCVQKGSTPLVLASEHGHKDVVALLLDRGAKVDRTNIVSVAQAVRGHTHQATNVIR
jgi:ankyrin repeat protein